MIDIFYDFQLRRRRIYKYWSWITITLRYYSVKFIYSYLVKLVINQSIVFSFETMFFIWTIIKTDKTFIKRTLRLNTNLMNFFHQFKDLFDAGNVNILWKFSTPQSQTIVSGSIINSLSIDHTSLPTLRNIHSIPSLDYLKKTIINLIATSSSWKS